jgi:NAD(P)-dependent dehydrogenase (short-subunit alcohol dehydrogenase family)
MRINLDDKVALVTGAAHRVGRAIALELAKNGVHILMHYNNSEPSQVRDTLQDIKSFGVDGFSIQADISQPEGVDTIFEAVLERFGRLDIVVNSASVFQRRELLEVSLADWDLTMNVNLRAPFLITQRTVDIMADNAVPGGTIVNICDQGVDRPWKEYSHHGISKSALWSLTQVSALTLGPSIRVNAIVPGPVMKPAGRNISDEDWDKVGERTPLKKVGSAEDVARAVRYLCEEDFLTGTLIHVNAGDHLT